MKKILIVVLLLVASFAAIAGKQKTFKCPECQGAKRIKEGAFTKKCESCNGKGEVNKKQLQKCHVNIYIVKTVKNSKGIETKETKQVKCVDMPHAKVIYNRKTKQFKIQYFQVNHEKNKAFKQYKRR